MAAEPLSGVLAKSATNGHSKDTQSYLVAAFKRQLAKETASVGGERVDNKVACLGQAACKCFCAGSGRSQ